MPSLTEIYEYNSQYVKASGFTVVVDESMPWVSIEDSEANGYFLQGEEAERYINEARAVWNEAQDLTLEDAFTGHAKPYIDCL